MKGRLAVMTKFSADFDIREYTVPEVEPDAALVRITRGGICGSDLHIWRGELQDLIGAPDRGQTFGHEMCGVIERLGKNVSKDSTGAPLKEGDRVTYCYFYPCEHCPACLDGHRAACPNKRRGTRYADDPPHFVGSYGEYFYLRPGHFVYKVPDSISDDVATPVNCALAQVLYGLDRVRVRVGDTVVIQGAGGLGLNAAAVAKEMGAANIIVIDQIPERLELARRFGADHTLSLQELSRPEDRVAAVKDLTRGWGADVVCDFVGFPSVIPEGLQMLKSGGTYLEIGHISPGHKFEFHPASIVWRSQTIVGMIQYDPWAIQRGLTFLEKNQRKYPFTEVISHVYPLEKISEAFREAEWLGRQHSPHKISRAAIAPWGEVAPVWTDRSRQEMAMAMAGERIEPWMMEEVKKFIEGEFLEATVDYFPRGNGSAVLFRVEGRPSHTEPRRLLHQLWLDRTFFLRCPDRTTLMSALEGTDLVLSMKKAGDKIVELH